jgi:subtilisin-like proprotein convertase family protein
VDESATVDSVGVSVEISHTFVGDLQVSLIGPDGTSVMLHNRTGGGRDDLVQTYDSDNTPGLSQFANRSASGNWTLQVRDRAGIDIGSLDRWSLSLHLAGIPRTVWETSPGLAIPDNDRQGVVSELEVDGVGELRDIEVTVDITHTYRGDLRVDLETPDARSVAVHNRTGGGRDHLQRTFRLTDTPALRAIVNDGVEINGTWKLRVADHANVDLGKLNSWQLKLLT